MGLSLRHRIGMILRGAPVRRIQTAYAQVQWYQLPITLDQLEQHCLSGGNIEQVIETAADAPRENLDANLRKMFAADLQGLNLREFVARGFLTEQELELVNLRAAAKDRFEAAAQLHGMLLRDLESLDNAARRYEASTLPARYKEQAAEAFPQKRAMMMDEIRALEARFPELRT